MSINKILLKDDRRLVNTVKQQSRFIRELKTPQKSGADVLPISESALSSVGPINIPSITDPTHGNRWLLSVDNVPTKTTLTLWNILFTIYIDSYDDAHKYPDGSAISSPYPGLNTDLNLKFRVTSHMDYLDSDSSTNRLSFKIIVENNDTSAHNVYIDILNRTPFA